jgi:hypothetical protein
MKITININTDHAAFGDGNFANEMRVVLMQVVEQLTGDTAFPLPFPLVDSNGNRVGTVDMSSK